MKYAIRTHLLESTRVLIVEDDGPAAQVLSETMAAYGAAPQIARSGGEALSALERSQPDIVLLDIVLPDILGTTILAHMKKSRGLSQIPVVIISGNCSGESRLDPLEMGADYVLEKPYSSRELVAVMEQRLGSIRRASYETMMRPSQPKGDNEADRFLHALRAWVDQHHADTCVSVSRAAHDLGYSDTVLQRKIRRFLNTSFLQFLIHWRLERAYQIIIQGAGNMAEVAWSTGFATPSYFTCCFRRRYGITPKRLSLGRDGMV